MKTLYSFAVIFLGIVMYHSLSVNIVDLQETLMRLRMSDMDAYRQAAWDITNMETIRVLVPVTVFALVAGINFKKIKSIIR